jgi:hypothetical protein
VGKIILEREYRINRKIQERCNATIVLVFVLDE